MGFRAWRGAAPRAGRPLLMMGRASGLYDDVRMLVRDCDVFICNLVVSNFSGGTGAWGCAFACVNNQQLGECQPERRRTGRRNFTNPQSKEMFRSCKNTQAMQV